MKKNLLIAVLLFSLTYVQGQTINRVSPYKSSLKREPLGDSIKILSSTQHLGIAKTDSLPPSRKRLEVPRISRLHNRTPSGNIKVIKSEKN